MESTDESSNYLISDVMPTAMPVTVTMTDSYFYSDISMPLMPRTCTIETTVDIDVDAQDARIKSVSTPSLEVTSGTGIDDWIEYVSHSSTLDQKNKSVKMEVTCKIKYEMSVGAITTWSKETINYIANFKKIPYISYF